MHEPVGKNGIGHPPLAPARILRPGDTGFPGDAGASVVAASFRDCHHPGCSMRFLPTRPSAKYCAEHDTVQAQLERDDGMKRTPASQRPAANRKESSMAKVRTKFPAKAARTKACAHPGCGKEFTPAGRASKYCQEHGTKAKGGSGDESPPSTHRAPVAEALGNLRKKADGANRQAAGQKADQGKLELDLILGDFPRALEAIARVGQHGNDTKYEPGSWVNLPSGQQRVANAALRHWIERKKGFTLDPESGHLALAHETWNKLAELELVLRAQEA